jgi:L-fuconolactonase
LRIDAHHSFNERYTLEYLDTILKRNRFDGSIAVVDSPIERWHILRGDLLNANRWTVGGWGSARAALQCRLPLDTDDAALAVELAQSNPTLRIAIDHLPPAPAGLERGAAHPNIYLKLCGITSIEMRPAVRHAMALFGPDRLMFGSDWPNHLPEFSWKATLAAFTQCIGAQPIEIREQLLGGTAQQFYGLPDTLG